MPEITCEEAAKRWRFKAGGANVELNNIFTSFFQKYFISGKECSNITLIGAGKMLSFTPSYEVAEPVLLQS